MSGGKYCMLPNRLCSFASENTVLACQVVSIITLFECPQHIFKNIFVELTRSEQ